MLLVAELLVFLLVGVVIGYYLSQRTHPQLYNTYALHAGMGFGAVKSIVLINGNCIDVNEQEIEIGDQKGALVGRITLASGIIARRIHV